MDILNALVLVVLGLAVAFLGRKLLWLFIAAAGFVIAYQLTSRFLGDSTVSFVISVGVGAVAGYYATKFANLLVSVAGFILVGNAALTVYGWFFSTENFWVALIVFLIGGLIALGLIRTMFALAIIIISALGGASMVAEGAGAIVPFLANPLWSTIISIVVLALGIIYQYRVYKAEQAQAQS